jgi:hypothetical protein
VNVRRLALWPFFTHLCERFPLERWIVGSLGVDPSAVIESSPSKAHDVGLRDVAGALVVALLAGILYIATLQPDLGGPEI